MEGVKCYVRMDREGGENQGKVMAFRALSLLHVVCLLCFDRSAIPVRYQQAQHSSTFTSTSPLPIHHTQRQNGWYHTPSLLAIATHQKMQSVAANPASVKPSVSSSSSFSASLPSPMTSSTPSPYSSIDLAVLSSLDSLRLHLTSFRSSVDSHLLHQHAQHQQQHSHLLHLIHQLRDDTQHTHEQHWRDQQEQWKRWKQQQSSAPLTPRPSPLPSRPSLPL